MVLSLFASKCDVRCLPQTHFSFLALFIFIIDLGGVGAGGGCTLNLRIKKEFSSGFVVKLELPPVIYRVHQTLEHPSFSTVPQCIQIKLSFSLFNADFPL